MKRVNIFTAIVLGAFITFTGFQCSSTELTSAKLYIQQKNWDKAIEALNKEVTKNPKSDEGFYLLGTVHAEKEDMDKMIESYDKSLTISKKYEKEINNARKYHWANFFNRGVAFFNRAAQQTNRDSSVVLYNKSVFAFDQSLKLQPDSIDAHNNIAFIYMNLQKFDEAIPHFMKLIEKQRSPDSYKYVGQIYYNKGVAERTKFEESKVAADSLAALNYFNKAITILEEGKKILPNDADILLYLSNSYIAANKVDVAIDAFKAGVVAEPGNKFYRYNYGVLLLGDSQFESAAEQFKKAVDLDPAYQNAIYNLAVTYVKWGAKIAKDYEIANKGNKDAKEETQSKEKYKAALPYLESYVQKKTDDAQIWELLGKVYTVMGMPNDASNAFKKADAIRKGN